MSLKAIVLLLTMAFLAISQINPPFPKDQSLQNIPTVIAIGLLACDLRWKWLALPAFLCVAVFFWMHILGARYVYSCIPYDAWSQAIFGVKLSQWFGFERNHYDRLVHFAFGWLFVLAFSSILQRSASIDGALNLCLAFCIVTTLSGIYEVFEWFLTIVMSPRDAEAYNGQQGDNWDAQKDIGLAILGSLFAFPFKRFARSL